MTADDPLTGAEILHWLNSGAPDGWSWPLDTDPWELVDQFLGPALSAVLRMHYRTERDICHHCYDVQGGDDTNWPCPTARAIATALGLDT